MNTQAQKRQRSRPSKPLTPQELALRIPTAEERREVAHLLKLSDEQSDLLWRRVDSMCRQFVDYRQATALPGTERRALLAEARRWSRRLAAFEESVAEASPHLTRKLGRFIGPVLAAALNEQAFWGPSQTFPVDRYSIHDLDLLECWFDPKTKEHQGVERTSANRFLRRVESHQLQRRYNAAAEEAIPVLRALLRSVHRPVLDFLALSASKDGGSPGKTFRNAAVSHLADVFTEVTGEQPTTSVGGRFVTLCDQVLIRIGIDPTGLDEAAKRILRRRSR